jgi:hypothetical protein
LGYLKVQEKSKRYKQQSYVVDDIEAGYGVVDSGTVHAPSLDRIIPSLVNREAEKERSTDGHYAAH